MRYTLISAGVAAAAIAVFWVGSRLGPSGMELDAPTRSVTLGAAQAAACALELQQPREVEVRRALAAPLGNGERQISDVRTIRSHGKLSATVKDGLRLQLERSVAGVDKQLFKAMNAVPWDIEAEAKLAEIRELRLAQLRMLESDEYVTLDTGAVREIWPTSPAGFQIVTMDTIQMEGVAVDLVFPVEVAKHDGLSKAGENRAFASEYSAQDAAFRFNGLSDEVRAAVVKSPDAHSPDASNAAMRAAKILYHRAILGGMILDNRKLLLVAKN